MLRQFLASIMLLVAVPSFAGPMINVGELNEYIQPTQNNLAKRINNSGDATAFVRVSVDEMIFTTEGYTENKLNADALIKGSGTGLISSPARLIIPAKGMQTNRLVFTGNRDKEHYYRVRYIPVVPEDIQEFGITKEEAKKYQDDIRAGVTVLTGFGTIVTVLPVSSRFDTRIEETGSTLNIKNNGNASIVVHSLKECTDDKKECSNLTNQQLRPGMSLTKPITAGKNWSYTLYEGTQKREMATKIK